MPKENNYFEIMDTMTDALSGLNDMIGGSSQMVQHRLNPKWIAIRDYLNIIKDRIEGKMKGIGM